MLSKWPIRNKLLVGIGLLLVIVATLSWSGFHGVYAYRSLVRSLRGRADELPLAAMLSEQVSNLQVILGGVQSARRAAPDGRTPAALDHGRIAQEFAGELAAVRTTLGEYRDHLDNNNPRDSLINDSRGEWATMKKIDATFGELRRAAAEGVWVDDATRLSTIESALGRLQVQARELPQFLFRRIHDFAGEVRIQYRTLIFLTSLTTILAGLLLYVLIRLFYAWVIRPLRVLVEGSRRVAAGEFGYRIVLDTHDEMSELSEAMNDMTARFEAIRDGLDRQVQERTKQVVRSEQLASVGFLAAGVAHEINNPLASIALCAESLESRLAEALEPQASPTTDDQQVIHHYLKMIQDEAFRCKGITERLLDFSRIGDVKRHDTDLRELVQGVIDMVGHLGRYHDKHIEFAAGEAVVASVNPQELKQVVLNLITNGLDSLSPGGVLAIELTPGRDQVELVFTDNGCGMTDEVQKHLFEPFFTRRRNGQGTGLGLSITYRIVADHGGHIDAHSEGPGRGSQFRVSLPLGQPRKEHSHRYQAA